MGALSILRQVSFYEIEIIDLGKLLRGGTEDDTVAFA